MANTENITNLWIKSLRQKIYNVNYQDLYTVIEYDLNKKYSKNVKINEAEAWFVVTSRVFDVEHFVNPKIDWELVVSAINEDVPIGFFIFDKTEAKKNYIFVKDEEGYFEIIYRTQQCFVKNDDEFNIKRTIDLHKEDHKKYFKKFFKKLDLNDLTLSSESIIKNFKEIVGN